MSGPLDEAGIGEWLQTYLVDDLGADAPLDRDASFNDLGVGSRDSVVLAGELSERVGRTVSPLELWEHPTVNALARFLAGAGDGVPGDVHGDADVDARAGAEPGGAAAAVPHAPHDDAVAVVGLGCRFPGGIDSPDAFWDFLVEGRSAVGEMPAQRWAPFDDGSAEVADVLANTTRFGAVLDDPDAFDAEFFEILPREAAKMDPQQRLLLEVAWEALEHAGIQPGSLRHSQTGVFVGASVSEYGHLTSLDLPGVDAWNNTGGALSIIANRLSYALDLRGPSLAVDTACSSSLVALHLACQSLRTGDSDLALAGGVNLLMSPAVFRGLDEAGALSPTGACHAFTAEADGFVRGEGCGVAVLKRLGDARRDGDRVLAVVRGSAVNSDGRSNGLMAPNPSAQMAVLRRAYAVAGTAPADVDYVEAHGTGTFLGDPIEARALGTVLGRGRPASRPLLLGAVKTNLGHLEAAAGIAGFAKAVLALHRGVLPPNRGFTVGNPHIAFDKLKLRVVDTEQAWPATGAPRRAGVSSFGFGGTNAHVVLEQAPRSPDVPSPESDTSDAAEPSPVTTLVVAGRSVPRIAATAGRLADWLAGPGADAPLPGVAAALAHQREDHRLFATAVVRDHAGAVTALRALADGSPATGVLPADDAAPAPGPTPGGTVFVYSGQGAHWAGMGRALLADEPAFAAAVDDIEPLFVEHVGFSLREVLADGREVRGDAQVQPTTMGLQLALTAALRAHGVAPDAVIGHSMGEVTAAVVAGALTVAEGLRVIATRSSLMGRLAGRGAVAALRVDADEAAALLAGYPGVALAGVSAPRQTVVAGPPAAVDALIADLGARNVFARRVNMEVASHTAGTDEILPELRDALADLTPTTPRVRFVSTVADPTLTPAFDADYWVANVRRPVAFRDAVAAAGAQYGTFVEVSAHPLLSGAVAETLAADLAEDGPHRVVGTLRRDADDTVELHTALAALHAPAPRVAPRPAGPLPDLPTTPWHHTRHWAAAARRTVRAGAAAPDPDAVPAEWFATTTWQQAPVPVAAPSPGESWLVVGAAALGAALGRALGDPSRVRTLDPAALEGGATALLGELAGTGRVVFAPAVDADVLDAAAGYRVFGTARALVAAMASMMLPPTLTLLTRDAQPGTAGDESAANAAHATLWGLGRTLALEHPELWGTVVDVAGDDTDDAVAAAVLAEASADDGEDQAVYRDGVRRVPRLRRTGAPTTASAPLTPERSHLVIGATGNIGPSLMRQLADMSAGTVVAVSRRPGDRLDALADELAERGTRLVTVAVDAADPVGMEALFARFGDDLPPLGGIWLAAFGGGPVTLSAMSDDDVSAMFRPKLDVLSLVHRLSAGLPVERFVLFSSISGQLGSRWLAHYTATSAFLDTFAAARRAAGLPANAVAWGYWKSLADSQPDEVSGVTIASGLLPMPDEVAIRALADVTGADAPTRCAVVSADWPLLATAYRTRAALRIVEDLLVPDAATAVAPAAAAATSAAPAGDDIRARFAATAPDGRRALVVGHVTTLVAGVMGVEARTLDPTAGFFQFGMDSLMSVTLQRTLTAAFGVTVPTSVVFDYPTVDALAGHLAAELSATLPAESPAGPPDPGAVGNAADPGGDSTGGGGTGPQAGPAADDYDDLSEEELLAQLSERLG